MMSEFLRRPQHRYEDPLARLWIRCAERIGFRIARSPDVYASTDGRGTIWIGTDETLDPDDSLAQMIFHELCHALVEGEDAEAQPDWGLDNTSNRHRWREHACLRLQAYLAASVGLRDFFAPTTDFRVTFWESLPADPFAAPPEAGGRREPSCVAARIAAWRASRPRWAPHLREALEASADVASILRRGASDRDASAPKSGHLDGLASGEEMASLWTTVREVPPLHPARHSPVAAYHAGQNCRSCAWSLIHRKARRCRHAPNLRLADETPACMRWEPIEELECAHCGACCREAYHAVEVGPREKLIRSHPEWVVSGDHGYKLRRDGDRCAALQGGRTPTEAYSCSLYDVRPRSCREFLRGGIHCLDARQRVGLSL